MSNALLEDGYTQIENEIIEALCLSDLNKSELKVAMFILRKTNGWHKQEDMIAISQFVDGTGLSKRIIIYSLQNLEAKKVITIKRKRKGKIMNEINKISFQKNIEFWAIEKKSPQYQRLIDCNKKSKKKSGGCAKRRDMVVQKPVEKGGIIAQTKETITKEITNDVFRHDSEEVRLSELLFFLIRKRDVAHIEPDIQTWALHINKMIKSDHHSVEDIEKIIRWCQDKEFWRKHILSTDKLREKFDTLWKQSGFENRKPFF
jgi:phage replication O-like protein O